MCCGSQDDVEGQVVGGRVLGGEGDDEYSFSGMLWADKHWLFDMIEELLDLDVEPKPESVKWTRAR